MSDQPVTRIFKIGANRIVADGSMDGLSIEQIRECLKSQYPELAHADYRQRQEGDTLFVEYIPRAGRKG